MATKTITKKKAENISAPLYAASGKSAGTVELTGAVFNQPWNADLVHQVVIGMQANARTGLAHTKFRGEVSGSGAKPWQQKGTGRARHGSKRSPIWIGGGVSHGPRNEKDYSVKINRKSKTVALFATLSEKLRKDRMLFVDAVDLSNAKTKDLIDRGLVKVGDKKVMIARGEIKVDTKFSVKELAKTKVIFEDDDILVVDKPAFITADEVAKTFKNAILLNRLDKETSGVMMFAKNEEFQKKAIKEFAQNRVYKEYVAIVEGKVVEEIEIGRAHV